MFAYPAKESVQAVNFVLFLHICVVLRNAFERQLFHQIDCLFVFQMAFLDEHTKMDRVKLLNSI